MTNLAKRIIPCLDLKDGRVVKGVNFVGLRDAGDPIDIAKKYNDSLADELVFLDISASHEHRSTTFDIIDKIARNVFIPLTIGGGISTLDDISRLLDSGCDKVSLNSAAIKNPNLIDQAANKFGSQCVVIAVDVKLREDNSIGIFTHGGRNDSGKHMGEWLLEVQNRGAGEILLTSMDSDGAKSGFDTDKLRLAMELLHIPIIASGGAGSMQHFLDVFNLGVDAALAASVFHYGQIEIIDLKKYLSTHGINVRI